MAAIVNDRDVLLQAASVRKLVTTGVAVIPTPSSSNFYSRADGTHGPDYIRITVSTILCDGPFTFVAEGATLSNITASTADIAFADMTSALALVTVTAANAGTPVQGSCIVGMVSDGQSGQGVRGAGVYYATGGAWSDAVAQAACPGGVALAGDVVTISNGTTYALTKKYDGSAWSPLGGVYDGSLFVTGSIAAAAINTNGLVVRDLQGNPIVGIGQPLPATYFGGTLGGDNLMRNSSFEQFDANTQRPLGYSAYNNASISTSFLNVAGRLGGRAFAIRANATGASQWGLYSSNDLIDGTVAGGVTGGWQPNKTYVMSFKARKVNGAGMSKLLLRWNANGGGGPSPITDVSNPSLSTAWQTYTFRFTWPATVEGNGHIYLDANGYGGSIAVNDEFHVDELIVQEGDVYSEWFPSSAEAKAAADAANAAISTISSDNVLSKGEKPDVIQRWNTVDAEHIPLANQADSLGVNRDAYWSAYTALANYLPTGWSDTSVDTTIVGADFRTYWTNYYTAKQALLNAIAAKAATLANWTTVNGRPSHCRVVAAGGNAVGYNLGPGFYVESASSATYGAGRSYNLVVIRRSDRGIAFHDVFDVYGSINEAYRLRDVLNGYGSDVIVAVYTFDEPQQNSTDASLAAAMYRCGASKAVYGSPRFQYRSAYILVGIPGVGEGGGAEAYQGTVSGDTNAWCDIGLTIDNLGNYQVSANYTPRSLADYGYSGDYNATNGAPAGTNVGSTPAQTVESNAAAGKSASDAIPGINAAISDKLSKTSASSLAATITLTTGGSILSGTTTNGTYQSPGGFYGVQGGVVKFSVPISGDPTFAGQLIAAYGSFGAVSIGAGGSFSSGQTAYNTGTGWWWGYSGSTPVMSIGRAGGPGLLWDGTNLYINSPVMTALTAVFSGTLFTTVSNGLVGYGGLTVNTSGGTPQSYTWSVNWYAEGAITASYSISGGQGTATAYFQGNATNNRLDATIVCTVTFTDGRTATAYRSHTVTHGTYNP